MDPALRCKSNEFPNHCAKDTRVTVFGVKQVVYVYRVRMIEAYERASFFKCAIVVVAGKMLYVVTQIVLSKTLTERCVR